MAMRLAHADDVWRRLACPTCHVSVVAHGDRYRCPCCGSAFEVREGVPIMLTFDQRGMLKGLEQKRGALQPTSTLHGLKRRLMPPSASLNVAGGAERLVKMMPEGSAILEVGSGTRRLRADVINLEIDLFPNVDIVAAGDTIPFLDETFDLVVSQAVLEHVPQPIKVVDEMLRVLKPGGQIYVEVPFLQGYHADPHDYQRYTQSGIRYLLRQADELESGVAVGPSSALVWMIREYIPLFMPGFMRATVAVVVAWFTTPFKYLDFLVARRPGAHRIAAGLYFWGRKPLG